MTQSRLERWKTNKNVCIYRKGFHTIRLNEHQILKLAELMGDSEIAIIDCVYGHSGPGIYAYYSEYSDEGSFFLEQN